MQCLIMELPDGDDGDLESHATGYIRHSASHTLSPGLCFTQIMVGEYTVPYYNKRNDLEVSLRLWPKLVPYGTKTAFVSYPVIDID